MFYGAGIPALFRFGDLRFGLWRARLLIDTDAKTAEGAARLWQFKRKMVEAFVMRVDVLTDKTTKVTLDLKFPKASPDFVSRAITTLFVIALKQSPGSTTCTLATSQIER